EVSLRPEGRQFVGDVLLDLGDAEPGHRSTALAGRLRERLHAAHRSVTHSGQVRESGTGGVAGNVGGRDQGDERVHLLRLCSGRGGGSATLGDGLAGRRRDAGLLRLLVVLVVLVVLVGLVGGVLILVGLVVL